MLLRGLDRIWSFTMGSRMQAVPLSDPGAVPKLSAKSAISAISYFVITFVAWFQLLREAIWPVPGGSEGQPAQICSQGA